MKALIVVLMFVDIVYIENPPFSVLFMKYGRKLGFLLFFCFCLQISNLQIKERPEENGTYNIIPKSYNHKCWG